MYQAFDHDAEEGEHNKPYESKKECCCNPDG